jgi:hypothetical protein
MTSTFARIRVISATTVYANSKLRLIVLTIVSMAIFLIYEGAKPRI